VDSALRIERVGDGAIRVAGVLGFAQASDAFERSSEVLAGTASPIVVDVAGLQSIDSATLAVLIAWAARASRDGKTFKLAGAPPDLRALAQLCDAEPLLGIA
jgi:phospholipid transport system transporter-binding protein